MTKPIIKICLALVICAILVIPLLGILPVGRIIPAQKCPCSFEETTKVIRQAHRNAWLYPRSIHLPQPRHFPWADVVASLERNLDYKLNGQNSEEYIEELELYKVGTCSACLGTVYETYFCSPPRTWRGSCGQAGKLTICPRCGKQYSFECLMMN